MGKMTGKGGGDFEQQGESRREKKTESEPHICFIRRAGKKKRKYGRKKKGVLVTV